MKKVLFDTNVILDIALKRKEFFEVAKNLFLLIDENKIEGYVTASTITDIYYIAKKQNGHAQAIGFIENLITVVEIIGVDQETITKALASEFKDFEDAVQSAAAILNVVETIITRNTQDFIPTSSLSIITPQEFLKVIY